MTTLNFACGIQAPWARHVVALRLLLAALVCLWACGGEPPAEKTAESAGTETLVPEVRHVGMNPQTGGANAVASTLAALAHTAQFFGTTGDAAAQADEVLNHIDTALQTAGTSLVQAVKLNVYVSSAESVEPVKAAIAKRFPEGKKPAISFVEGAFMQKSALVAMDAVAMTSQNPGGHVAALRKSASLPGPEGGHHVGVLPVGTRIYISGRAAREGSVADATRGTMEQLKETLAFVGLGLEHVVHIKSFMQPIAEMAAAEAEIVKFFDGNAPPMAFTEWTSNNPIEIELIAASPDPSQAIPLEYLTPTGDNPSPVFSRIAKVYHPTTIYVSGLWGAAGTPSDKQIHEIFASLKSVLGELGSDLDHLVKATYYPANDDPSTRLNEIRPDYYDPKRPPAASKALVAGTGFAGRTITMDMIAVPAK